MVTVLSALQQRLFAAMAAAWCTLVVLLIWWPGVSHAPSRIGVASLVVATAAIALTRRTRLLLITPLFGLGVLSILFYSAMPLLLLDPAMTPERSMSPDNIASAERFLAGRGEIAVLQFSAMCLLGALVLARFDRRFDTMALWPGLPMGTVHRIAFGAAVVVVFASSVLAIRFLFPAVDTWMQNGVGREILHGAPPLIAVALATLFYCAADRGRGFLVAAAASAVLGGVALLTTYGAKAAVYILLSGLALFVVGTRLSWRHILVALAIGPAILVTGLVIIGFMRGSSVASDGSPWGFVRHIVVQKLLVRQTVTAGCFQNVLDRNLPAGRGESPLYFATGVVPRVLWPEKPNLSVGVEYGIAYCNVKPEYMAPGGKHSASITLLGEPVERAGWFGLAVAQTALLAALLCATALAVRAGPVGPIGLAALLPWLIDFDQSFALYVANTTKMFLWMIPMLVAVGLAFWNARRHEP